MVAKAFEQAIKAVEQLTEEEQEDIAQMIFDEIDARKHARVSNPIALELTLQELIDEAWQDIREGNTEELDPDNLP